MSNHRLEPPCGPTLMGMMMSCDDLPSTASASRSPSSPPRATRPASTWHSEVDTCGTSAASTAVGDSSVAIAVQIDAPDADNDNDNSGLRTPEKDSSDSIANLKADNFTKLTTRPVAMPVIASPATSHLGLGHDWDRHQDDESQAGSPPRSRKLGHIISISGLRRTLSQTDLALPGGPQRRTSRIRSAMTKVSRSWQQHFGPHGEERVGGSGNRVVEAGPPLEAVSVAPVTAAAR